MRHIRSDEWDLITFGLQLNIELMEKSVRAYTDPATKKVYESDIKKAEELIELFNDGMFLVIEEGDDI